jgi:hypothetical protein
MTARQLIPSLLLLLATAACGDDGSAPESPPCDEACRDETAARGLREVIKLAYNLTLQGNQVGEQDETTRCPHGGSARVAGVAVSNAFQGGNDLALGYLLAGCRYQRKDEDAEESYDVVVDGIITEEGTLAVQPTATTALIFESEAISISGTVYNPPFDYAETDCALRLVQNANHISGTWCEREIGFDL